MKYKKKPVEIEAVLWDGNKVSETTPWISESLENGVIIRYGDKVLIFSLEGNLYANPGDYIIKGTKGEIYPCKPDIFKQTYEPL